MSSRAGEPPRDDDPQQPQDGDAGGLAVVPMFGGFDLETNAGGSSPMT